MFLPASTAKVTTRSTVTYSALRDGFDGTASALALNTGYAGMTTLPTGAVVYATSGTGAGEGHIEVRNLTMPGIAGLTGSRTYTTAEGATTVPARDTAGPVPTGARTDELTLDRAEFRYVRMLGRGAQNMTVRFECELGELSPEECEREVEPGFDRRCRCLQRAPE